MRRTTAIVALALFSAACADEASMDEAEARYDNSLNGTGPGDATVQPPQASCEGLTAMADASDVPGVCEMDSASSAFPADGRVEAPEAFAGSQGGSIEICEVSSPEWDEGFEVSQVIEKVDLGFGREACPEFIGEATLVTALAQGCDTWSKGFEASYVFEMVQLREDSDEPLRIERIEVSEASVVSVADDSGQTFDAGYYPTVEGIYLSIAAWMQDRCREVVVEVDAATGMPTLVELYERDGVDPVYAMDLVLIEG